MNVPWTKPEEHDRVKLVNVWDEESWNHEEEQQMSQAEISGKVTKLGNLAEEFTTWLRHTVPSHRVPFTGPPSDVGSVSAELTSESESDDELVDETLDGHNSNHTQKSLGEVPSFQEEHDLKDNDEHEYGDTVGNGGEDSTKLLAAHAEKWSHTTGHGEEHDSDTSVDTDWSKGHNGNTDESVGRLEPGAVDVGVVLCGDTSL